MRIDRDKCVGCGRCVSYCPVGAIQLFQDEQNPKKKKSRIEEDECVECGVCLRAQVCKPQAIYLPELNWPRVVRRAFSDPMVEHKETGVPGRGTEEMKTNEVTGRFKRGSWGMAVEVGRPGVGGRLKDLETIAMALAKKGIVFEPRNPVTFLFEDMKTGRLKPELKNEKVLSAIIEFEVKPDQLKGVLQSLKDVSGKVETVFSVDLISFPEEREKAPALEVARQMGFPIYPNGKVNLGTGESPEQISTGGYEMTHTLHRTGDIESLKKDFPMLTHVARGYNDIGAGDRLKQMAEIARKYTDLNFGDCKVANKFMMPPEQIMEKHTVGWQVVFKDKKSLIACMKELKEKKVGISVVVSGLFDEVFDCCQKAGITPPLIEFALGIHGNKDKVWPPEILDFVTMCGHGLVSGHLVKRMVEDIKKKKITIKKAAMELAKPCLCGIFNPDRAAKLLKRMTRF